MVAGIAILRKTLTEVRKASEKLFQGEVTVSKKECWLVGAILVLSGIAIGLVNAPLTHGVSISIGSNNGSNNTGNGCNNANPIENYRAEETDGNEDNNAARELPFKEKDKMETKAISGKKTKLSRKKKKRFPAGKKC